MSENKKCPKCGNEMTRKKILTGECYYGDSVIKLMNTDDYHLNDIVVPFCCSNCGYIELYNEKNVGKK